MFEDNEPERCESCTSDIEMHFTKLKCSDVLNLKRLYSFFQLKLECSKIIECVSGTLYESFILYLHYGPTN